MNAVPPEAARTRGRRTLLILVALFVGPILLALVLAAIGLRPSSTKNKGEALKPYVDLRAQTPALADGGAYRWNPEQRLWRIAVAAPAGCAAQCVELAVNVETVRELLGREADRAQVLWIGTLPTGAPQNAAWKNLRADPALLAQLPGSTAGAAPATYVIDPYGFVVLRYPPGFDPADLRYDLAKLLKLK